MKKRKHPFPDQGDLVLVRIESPNYRDWLMPQAPKSAFGKREFPNIYLNTNQDYFGIAVLKYKLEGGEDHWAYHILLGEEILFLQTSLFNSMINAKLIFKKAKHL